MGIPDGGACFEKLHICVILEGMGELEATTKNISSDTMTFRQTNVAQEVAVLRVTDGLVELTEGPASITKMCLIEILDSNGNVMLLDEVPVVNGKAEMSLEGCFKDGFVLKTNASRCQPDQTIAHCSKENALETVEECVFCENAQCVFKTCTVSGSALVDFVGNVSSAPDRCAYTLLGHASVNVSAQFKEQRRTDVNLLDFLKLSVSGTEIEMRRGQVKVDNVVVNISTAQFPEGLNISKSATHTVLHLADMFDLYFDGHSAVINLQDSSGFSGSCFSGGFVPNKDALLSPAGCDVQHEDDSIVSTDCAAVTQHCDLLNGSLFSSCHSTVDPAPFMKACKDSRCQYPSEDTMVCSFHEAYATACSMGNVSLPEWRSTAQCDSTQGLCMDTFCANHEFCGIQGDKELCLCRALFASKYQANDTFGEPTVCDRNSASLSLAVCLLAEKGIHYKDLRLNDPNCTGQLNPESHMMDFKFDSVDMCGTEVTSENNQLVFKNKVVLQNHTTSIVTRHDQFELDFSCFYSQPEVKTVVLRIKDSSVVQTITSGTWQYNLTMKSYLDKGRTQPIASETELKLNQPIWVELSTEGLDQNLVSIVVQSSWATSHQLSTSKPRYDLVKNGCPNPRDTSVSVSGNGQGSSASFSFSMFKFSGDSAQVYLHCEVSLCVSKCVPECGSRRRRSLYKDPNPDPNPGLISMSWTN